MNTRKMAVVASASLCLCLALAAGCGRSRKPVTPAASKEARALLNLFYSISGRHILTGQHNYPNTRDRNTQFASRTIGKTPAVWSTDMGFAEDGDTDSYLARPDIVDEARRQHEKGSLVTICWHAVPPTAEEPVTFRPRRGEAAAESLATVQGRLTDSQFSEVLTPGTALHSRWCRQVDSVAVYLRKLGEAHVPVLWRPYHEMNGDWFWWGGRHEPGGTVSLYRQLYDRLVYHHKLDNLVWVWSVDRPNKPAMHFSHYYPGNEYLDIVALDVYGNDFNPVYYDSLVTLSRGKPLVLGEVGNPPALEIMRSQPKWAYYVVWAGMVRNTSQKQYRVLVEDPFVLSLEDAAYAKVIRPFRNTCGLPDLSFPEPAAGKPESASPAPARGGSGFPGEWSFNEEKSALDEMGRGLIPDRIRISLDGKSLGIQKTSILEWGDERTTEENLTLGGKPVKSEFWNAPRLTTAQWSGNRDSLIVVSVVTLNRGGQISEMVTREAYSLKEQDAVLSVEQSSRSFRGPRRITLVYDRQ
ncbi:hypothetical protein JW906_02780 [bacterium]|nr:hypothetical protein [bacterium]